MEVHHHAHTSRKKWTHYFWEFLMLFLAVFCGFLAEYQLEHVIEHQREKKYVHLLIHDLEKDTANLQRYINLRREKRGMMDSLVLLLSSGQHKQYGNETYFFARHVFTGLPFVSIDGTMQQLKNAGNLRLIGKGALINDILAYDAAVKNLKEWDESDLRIRTTFREIGGSVFDGNLFYKVMNEDLKFIKPTNNPQLITDNSAVINNVTFQVQYLALSCTGNIQRGTALKEQAKKLTEMLKQQYHF